MNPSELKQLYRAFSIEEIPNTRNYWLVRTNSGIYFKDFYKNGYISIGWDEFSDIEQIRNEKEEILKDKISKTYLEDKRPGYILNQIKRFMFDLKKGDMVLIPSNNSSLVAFGIITKEFYTENVPIVPFNPNNPKCLYKKRIKIKWIKTLYKDNFDPYMRMLMFTHTTISNINEYKNYINRTLYPIYVYNDEIHLTYHVQTTEDISFLNFSNFLNIILESLKLFDDTTNSNISTDKLDIKATMNSPGVIEIIGTAFGAGIVVALVNAFIFGGKFEIDLLKLGKISFEHDGLLSSILKFIKEANNNKIEMTKLKNNYDLQKRALKLKAPNEQTNDNNQK